MIGQSIQVDNVRRARSSAWRHDGFVGVSRTAPRPTVFIPITTFGGASRPGGSSRRILAAVFLGLDGDDGAAKARASRSRKRTQISRSRSSGVETAARAIHSLHAAHRDRSRPVAVAGALKVGRRPVSRARSRTLALGDRRRRHRVAHRVRQRRQSLSRASASPPARGCGAARARRQRVARLIAQVADREPRARRCSAAWPASRSRSGEARRSGGSCSPRRDGARRRDRLANAGRRASGRDRRRRWSTELCAGAARRDGTTLRVRSRRACGGHVSAVALALVAARLPGRVVGRSARGRRAVRAEPATSVRDLRLGYDADPVLLVHWERRGASDDDSRERVALRRRLLDVARVHSRRRRRRAGRATCRSRERRPCSLFVPGIDSVGQARDASRIRPRASDYFAAMGTRILRGRCVHERRRRPAHRSSRREREHGAQRCGRARGVGPVHASRRRHHAMQHSRRHRRGRGARSDRRSTNALLSAARAVPRRRRFVVDTAHPRSSRRHVPRACAARCRR